ncbi:UBX domain-containing protein 5 [Monosporozyma unispora]
MSEEINNFMAITDCADSEMAQQFIEMANGDLNTAISLYFEHGAGVTAPTTTSSNHVSGFNVNDNNNNDANLAKRLQKEENIQEAVRAPMEFRQEVLTEQPSGPGLVYGGIGGSFEPLSNVGDMFDTSRPVGVFNQRLNTDYDSGYGGYDENADDGDDSNMSDSQDEDDSDEYEYVEEPVVEIDDDGNIQETSRLVKKLKTYSKQERLARLFRPPFEIMSKLTLDGARAKGRRQGKMKWIMINIQDNGIFQCQALNRDVWSSRRVKRLVKRNFIFLQYQYESRLAEQYLNYYNLHDKDLLPHIAILDPMTGERMKKWDTYLPSEDEFLKEINEFLDEFSLDPAASNPLVKEKTPELDPTTMTEEQQMDMAIRESLTASPKQSSEEVETIETTVPQPEIQEAEEQTASDPFNAIKPVKHVEPDNKPGISTRIQIRTGDGNRFVRRFNCQEDTVQTIYEVVKTELPGYETSHFTLSDHQRHNLLEKLSQSIEDAGLKNSSLLLEATETSDKEEE